MSDIIHKKVLELELKRRPWNDIIHMISSQNADCSRLRQRDCGELRYEEDLRNRAGIRGSQCRASLINGCCDESKHLPNGLV